MCDRRPTDQLLLWYDTHARTLPWRIPPAQSKQGVLPDPYHIWLSEVMLQQTTVAAVRDYYTKFVTRWPSVTDLARAADEEVMAAWAGLGYYARARNLLKCARVVAFERGGRFPQTQDELIKLPGIGPYTAGAIAAIAFGQSAVVVDGNVERVMARLYDVHSPLPTAKPALAALAKTLTPPERAGDHAQAVMDLGATICTPKSPKCAICPLSETCLAAARGTAAQLPRKRAKTPKPTRVGVVYIAQRQDGAYLLEQRPNHGLLGGMLGWPGSDWAEDPLPHVPPLTADWHTIGARARHTFTHFHLSLTVKTARVPMGVNPIAGQFVPLDAFDRMALPTVMRKAFDLTQGNG